MHYPELQGYLIGACSADEVALFDRGVKTLESFEVDEHMDVFERLIGEVSSRGDTETVDALKSTLTTMLNAIVELHGVQLSEDAQLLDMLDLLDALQRLPDWADKESLKATCDGEGSVEERFCDVLALISSRPDTDFMAFITQVEADTLDLVRELTSAAPELQAFTDEVKSYIADYGKLRNAAGHVDGALWADQLLAHAGALGVPFSIQLRRFVNENTKLIAAAGEDRYRRLSIEVLGVAALSDVRLGGALVAVQDEMEQLYHDPQQTTGLLSALTKLYAEANRAQA